MRRDIVIVAETSIVAVQDDDIDGEGDCPESESDWLLAVFVRSLVGCTVMPERLDDSVPFRDTVCDDGVVREVDRMSFTAVREICESVSVDVGLRDHEAVTDLDTDDSSDVALNVCVVDLLLLCLANVGDSAAVDVLVGEYT